SDRAARGRTSPGPREEEAVLAGRRHVDVVVMRLEAVAERLRHLLLVLDDEDTHIERVWRPDVAAFPDIAVRESSVAAAQGTRDHRGGGPGHERGCDDVPHARRGELWRCRRPRHDAGGDPAEARLAQQRAVPRRARALESPARSDGGAARDVPRLRARGGDGRPPGGRVLRPAGGRGGAGPSPPPPPP